MTNEQAINIMKIQRPRKGTKEKLEAYDMAIKALEQEPCEDCISREAVENAIKHAEVNFTVNSAIDFTKHKREVHEIVDGIVDAQIKALRALPPVTPQPKVGVWLKNGELCKCSNCHSLVLRSVVKSYNYCFRCGAKMEVSE